MSLCPYETVGAIVPAYLQNRSAFLQILSAEFERMGLVIGLRSAKSQGSFRSVVLETQGQSAGLMSSKSRANVQVESLQAVAHVKVTAPALNAIGAELLSSNWVRIRSSNNGTSVTLSFRADIPGQAFVIVSLLGEDIPCFEGSVPTPPMPSALQLLHAVCASGSNRLYQLLHAAVTRDFKINNIIYIIIIIKIDKIDK
jgi:hypothetical protein